MKSSLAVAANKRPIGRRVRVVGGSDTRHYSIIGQPIPSQEESCMIGIIALCEEILADLGLPERFVLKSSKTFTAADIDVRGAYEFITIHVNIGNKDLGYVTFDVNVRLGEDPRSDKVFAAHLVFHVPAYQH